MEHGAGQWAAHRHEALLKAYLLQRSAPACDSAESESLPLAKVLEAGAEDLVPCSLAKELRLVSLVSQRLGR